MIAFSISNINFMGILLPFYFADIWFHGANLLSSPYEHRLALISSFRNDLRKRNDFIRTPRYEHHSSLRLRTDKA